MPAVPFSAEVRADANEATVWLHGDLNAEAEDALDQAYAAAAGVATVIVLDFSHVGFMNSTGIALIVGLLADAPGARRSLRARGLSDHYREIFDITRLSEHIPLVDGPASTTRETGGTE